MAMASNNRKLEKWQRRRHQRGEENEKRNGVISGMKNSENGVSIGEKRHGGVKAAA